MFGGLISSGFMTIATTFRLFYQSNAGLFNADTLDGWAPVWGWNKLIPSAAVV